MFDTLLSTKIKKDVKKRYNEALYEDDKQINIRESVTLDEWYKEWMNVYKFDVIRENTKKYYNTVYKKHISPYLGMFNLADITQYQIKKRLKELKENGYKFETCNKVKILLVDIFNKALINEYVRRNPAKGIALKRDEKKDIRVLTREEQVTFFDCCKGTFYDNLFVTAVSTGMRIGELAALKWEDIDWDHMVINVRKTLVYQQYEGDAKKDFHFENPKTNTSTRKIPINRQCELALKKQFMQKRAVASKQPITKNSYFSIMNGIFVLFFDKIITRLRDGVKYICKFIHLCLHMLWHNRCIEIHCHL